MEENIYIFLNFLYNKTLQEHIMKKSSLLDRRSQIMVVTLKAPMRWMKRSWMVLLVVSVR